jgi:DNA-binding XRE family transcriptional regulator
MGEMAMSDNIPPYLKKAILEGGAALGAALKIARRRRALRQEDMAQKVGVTPRTIIRLEKGDTKVNLATLLACLSVYGLLSQLTDSVAPSKDLKGEEKERIRLPERVRKKNQVREGYDLSKL